jgi:hypothetical protein
MQKQKFSELSRFFRNFAKSFKDFVREHTSVLAAISSRARDIPCWWAPLLLSLKRQDHEIDYKYFDKNG